MALITSTFKLNVRPSTGNTIGCTYATTTYKLLGLLPLWSREQLIALTP